MIAPTKPTRFDRTPAELEEWLIFSALAPDGEDWATARTLADFLGPDGRPPASPFESIFRRYELNQRDVREGMTIAGIDPYDWDPTVDRMAHDLAASRSFLFCGMASTILYVAATFGGHKLATVKVKKLESLHVIGMKAARYFALHSRRKVRVAAIDVVVSRHMVDAWGLAVPTTRVIDQADYLARERLFLDKADELGRHPADLDREIREADRARRKPSKSTRAKSGPPVWGT